MTRVMQNVSTAPRHLFQTSFYTLEAVGAHQWGRRGRARGSEETKRAAARGGGGGLARCGMCSVPQIADGIYIYYVVISC